MFVPVEKSHETYACRKRYIVRRNVRVASGKTLDIRTPVSLELARLDSCVAPLRLPPLLTKKIFTPLFFILLIYLLIILRLFFISPTFMSWFSLFLIWL